MAFEAGVIVGWVVAGPYRDEDRTGLHQGEIYGCYVLPARWRDGVGRQLVTHAVAALTQAERADVTLWVLEANDRARRFYENCGF
ncbi:MAG TPA: GNAT family N-acetyltransferase [Candidatus Saccharimonadales bacterium]|nr:GNAT family N-acetyltransferase [Candidatus Saccharimonadales bacterium]